MNDKTETESTKSVCGSYPSIKCSTSKESVKTTFEFRKISSSDVIIEDDDGEID